MKDTTIKDLEAAIDMVKNMNVVGPMGVAVAPKIMTTGVLNGLMKALHELNKQDEKRRLIQELKKSEVGRLLHEND